MKNTLTVSFKSVIRNKKTIALIIVLAISFFLGTIISVYQVSTENKIKEHSRGRYADRMILVLNEDKKIEDQLIELKDVPHIEDAFRSYDLGYINMQTDIFKRKNTDGFVTLYVSSNKTLPQITHGNNFPDNEGYYMICNEKVIAKLTLFDDKTLYKISSKRYC